MEELQISLKAAIIIILIYESYGAYLLGDFNDCCTQWTAPDPGSELK